jgi:hypothetical protein
LLLNVGKCKTITFARSRHPVELGGTVLDRVSPINNLGVIIDEKMTFSEHLDVMVAKAFAMLGFIRRFSMEFRELVRLKLEYASCVWNPFYDVRVDRVERVQRIYLICFAWFGLDRYA